MAKTPSVRLFVDHPLLEGAAIACDKSQAHYLTNVLRLEEGALIAVFNGRDGEWSALVCKQGKKDVRLEPMKKLADQLMGPDLHYLFAPIKRARLDYMVQKAVELGASHLRPVLTQHCQVERVNQDRMQANAIEAAEQCGIMGIPQIDKPIKLIDLIDEWDKARQLVFCDEKGIKQNPITPLKEIKAQKWAVLIGPEGGFSNQERDLLLARRFVTPLALGPRIMRAETAAVAALSLVNAVVGDW